MKVNTIDNVSYKGFQFNNNNSVSKIAENLSLERANDVETVLNIIKEQKNNKDTILLGVDCDMMYAENLQRKTRSYFDPILNKITDFFREIVKKSGKQSVITDFDYGYGKRHFHADEIIAKLENAVKEK